MKSLVLLMLLVSFVCSAKTVELLDPLFADQSALAVRLSPDGQQYVVADMRALKTTLEVFQSDTQKSNNQYDLVSIFDKDTVLRNIAWLDNQHIAVMLIDNVEVKTALYESNAQMRLIIFDITSDAANPLMYQVSTPGYLVDSAQNEAGVFYFSRSAHKSKIYRIEIQKLLKVGQQRTKLTRVDGGQFVANNVVAETEGYAVRWFYRYSGKPAAVLLRSDIDTIKLAVYKTEGEKDKPEPVTVKTWKLSEFSKQNTVNKTPTKEKSKENDNSKKTPLFIPIAISKKIGKFYCLDFHETQALSLYLVDFEKDQHEQIFTSPGLSIVDLIFAENHQAIGVTVLEQGYYKESYFDGQPSHNDRGQPSNNKPDLLSVVTGSSLDGKTQLVYQEAHNQPGSYHLKMGQQKSVLVSKQYRHLPNVLPTRQVSDTVKVGDFDIPFLLTLPDKASNTAPAPLILIPHGGPFDVYDSPYFNANAQFFAANGMAVLRVNFRGSGGYGLAHRDAGKKQWGDLMLQDLFSATQKVQSRADIDASRICVVGMSYGGYAALMLSLKHPNLFNCAVSVAGVTDINLFVKSPYLSSEQQLWAKEFVGDANTEYARLKANSPIYQITKLTTPLLLIHGAEDEIVNVENAFRAKMLLEQANIPFEWRLFDTADHHFAKDDQHQQLYEDIFAFVSKHLTKQ
jgi:dipeptidyl aminopeptidase/acylaminoacyl peptidase